MDIFRIYREIFPALLSFDAMYARKADRDGLTTACHPAMKQCIRSQWFGDLQGHLDTAFIVRDQMFRPDANLHSTIRDICLADNSVLKHNFAAADSGIEYIHGGTANELGGEQGARCLIDLQRGADLFCYTFIHHDHPVCHSHRFDLIVRHIKCRYSQFALQFFYFQLEIKELQSKLGVTALYVTHDQVEAMTMADRMIVMNEGVAEQIGTPLEVYETPRTLFAAQFIGSPAMNIFDARISSGKIMFQDAVIGKTDVADGAVKVGIRPDANLHSTIRDICLADNSVLKHNFAAADSGIEYIHGGTANELGGEQGARCLIDLQRGADLFCYTFIHHDHPVCHSHRFDLIVRHIKCRYSQFALQFFYFQLEIKELQSKLGVTALYVTHDQVEAMTMADRMIVMNEGVAEQIGTPLEVYETPRTLFAAQFIGSPAMNIFDARISSGKIMFQDAVIGKTDVADGAVKVGIRPEHLVPDNKRGIEVSLQIAEPLGANTLLHGRVTGSGQSITVSLPGVHRIEAEQSRKYLSVNPEYIHLFDSSTGLRLEA